VSGVHTCLSQSKRKDRLHTKSVYISFRNYYFGICWHAVAQLVEALRYKPKVAGSIPDGVIFHWHIPTGRTMAPGSTQPLTETSTRNIFWSGTGGWCVGTDNLTIFICRLSWNLEALTSWNPLGLNRRKQALLYVYMCSAQAMLLVECRTMLSVHIRSNTVTTGQKADITTVPCLG
jgi:hypothetical protein